MKLMFAIGIPEKFAFVGLTLILVLGGCSSRQHTSVMSAEETQPQQDDAPDQETVQSSEPTPEPVLPEVETTTPEETLSPGPADVDVEDPTSGFISPETPVEPLESPTELSPAPLVGEIPETGREDVLEPETEITDMVESLPPVESGAELVPEPEISSPIGPTDTVPIPQPSDPPEIARLTPETLATLTDIFFDFDQFTIRRDAITTLENNARFLMDNHPDRTILIEGHCDERGTEEYNLVLGKRRAQAVKDYLVDLGIPEENLQVISFGKEKPFCTDHNPNCWQQNRRGHFVLNE